MGIYVGLCLALLCLLAPKLHAFDDSTFGAHDGILEHHAVSSDSYLNHDVDSWDEPAPSKHESVPHVSTVNTEVNRTLDTLERITVVVTKFKGIDFDAFVPDRAEDFKVQTSTNLQNDVVTSWTVGSSSSNRPGICGQDVPLYFEIATNDAPVETNPQTVSIQLRNPLGSSYSSTPAGLAFKDMQYCEFENTGYHVGSTSTPLPVANIAPYGAHPYGVTMGSISQTTFSWNTQTQTISFTLSNLKKNLVLKLKCVTTLACNPGPGRDASGTLYAISAGTTISYSGTISTYTFGYLQPFIKLTKWYDDADVGCTDPPQKDPRSTEVYYLRYPYERVLCYRLENLGAYQLYDISIADTLCDRNQAFVYPGVGSSLALNAQTSTTITISSTNPSNAHLFPAPSLESYACNTTASVTAYFERNNKKINLQTWLTESMLDEPGGTWGDVFPTLKTNQRNYILNAYRDYAIVDIPPCSLISAQCLWVNTTLSSIHDSITPEYCDLTSCSTYRYDTAGSCRCLEYLAPTYTYTGAPCNGDSCPCELQQVLLLNSSCNPVYL